MPVDRTDKQVDIPLSGKLLAESFMHLCEEGGAADIVCFSCSGEERIADEIIVATVGSERILGSLTEDIRHHLKQVHRLPSHSVPRHDRSGWVAIDCGEVVVHLMSNECRDYYRLDDLYAPKRTRTAKEE